MPSASRPILGGAHARRGAARLGGGGRGAGPRLVPARGHLRNGRYLRLIAIAGGAQGGGAGAALLAAFEAEVLRASRHAFLLVSDFNVAGAAVLRAARVARVGALPGLVLPEVAELVYWKRLR